jgi:hypothetical protein
MLFRRRHLNRVRRFPKVDTYSLKLRDGFVALACQEGECHECQTEPESGISRQGYPS